MIVIGTRGSDLALWQAHRVQDLLRERADVQAEIRIIKTAGDRIQDVSLGSMPGKGFFTKEIEEALLAGDIDLAVHSHKDLPTESPAGLAVAAVPERAPAAECLLVHPDSWRERSPLPLVDGARVGTGSARRGCQLLALRPDLELADIRGNVPTRARKVVEGEYGATILARAGIRRLGLDTGDLKVCELPPADFVPAPAQGALAIQVRDGEALREGDEPLRDALSRIHDEGVARLVRAERLLLAALEGGCNLPLGAHAVDEGGAVRLTAVLDGPAADGRNLRRCVVTADSPERAAEEALAALTS